MSAGECRWCACREDTPCPSGCAWTDDSRTICSLCAGAEVLAQLLVRTAAPLGDQRRVRLVSSAWQDLASDQQQLLVRGCASVLATTRREYEAQLQDEAVAALVEIETLAAFLAQHFRDDIRQDEPISLMVGRLLAPQLGAPVRSRIILPAEASR